MIIALDLHIHSGLSPCAEKDMTPNNIVNMALLKGLDVIAVTDHNSTKNLASIAAVAERKKLLFIPGIEITSREEVHLIALFQDISQALDFQRILDARLPNILNKASIFGNQYMYDEEDEIVGEVQPLLLNAIDLSTEEVIDEVRARGGLVIPAHVDRESFSIISNLGFISPHLGFTSIEVASGCQYSSFLEKHKYLEGYIKVVSSDAHCLSDILERTFFLEVEELRIDCVFKALMGKSNFV